MKPVSLAIICLLLAVSSNANATTTPSKLKKQITANNWCSYYALRGEFLLYYTARFSSNGTLHICQEQTEAQPARKSVGSWSVDKKGKLTAKKISYFNGAGMDVSLEGEKGSETLVITNGESEVTLNRCENICR